MNKLYVTALAAVFGLAGATSVAVHAAQHPAQAGGAGFFSGQAAMALADGDDHGNRGKHKGHDRGRGHNNRGNQNCGNYYGQNGQNGQWNANGSCTNCGSNGDRDDNQNNGNCGNYGNGNGGYGGRNQRGGNSQVSGLIVGVNGNQITLQEGIGRQIRVNDQPALDRQQTGRVYVGRSVTAYGYYQNATFYATSIQ
ncbi:MAG TPA: hypothetical protein VIG51_07635 [Candidatus Baltobacteraceae bacterium]|jgi:hypothetical protein